jgi:hypothetical protein
MNSLLLFKLDTSSLWIDQHLTPYDDAVRSNLFRDLPQRVISATASSLLAPASSMWCEDVLRKHLAASKTTVSIEGGRDPAPAAKSRIALDTLRPNSY